MTRTQMLPRVFKYTFDDRIAMPDVEAAFVLAIFAVEAIHGESNTRLLAEHALDVAKRMCVVDASTELGRDLNRLFVGFLRREFGDDAFNVERVDATPLSATTGGTR